MAKLLNGILGGISGKVGGVVGGKWKETNYIRAYAIPSNPNTAGQQAQRSKFSSIINLAKKLLASIIQPFWDPFISTMSGYNDFCRTNLLLWTDESSYDEAKVSSGNLEPESISSAAYAGTECDVEWSVSGLGDGLGTDKAVVVIYDTVNDIAFVSDAVVTRNSSQDVVNIGAGRVAANLKAYLFFYRGAGETLYVSDSDFFQVT